MKTGYRRFRIYTDQLESMMATARKDDNPALWLYKNSARTTFFMLQALARLYEKMQDGKLFGKIKERSKLAEDSLGRIDYYQWLHDSAKSINTPDNIRKYITGQLHESIGIFNKVLKEEDWLSKGNSRIEKINKKLKDNK